MALAIFQQILAPGCRVKYGNSVNKLAEGVNTLAKGPVSLVPVNISYSDTGLFGFSIKCQSNECGDLIKAAVFKMRDVAKSLKEEDLVIAK